MGLWHEDIEAGVQEVLEDIRKVETFVGVLRGVNSAVESRNVIGVYNYLSNNRERLGLIGGVKRENAEDYLSLLYERKSRCVGHHSWVSVQLDGGRTIWIEIEGGRHSWTKSTIFLPVTLMSKVFPTCSFRFFMNSSCLLAHTVPL